MAKSLTTMSVDALLEMRDTINKILSSRVQDVRQQLARLEGSVTSIRPRRQRRRKGGKVAAKYRGPKGESWSGRGLRPRWLTALVRQGRKVQEFAVSKVKPGKRIKRRRKK